MSIAGGASKYERLVKECERKRRLVSERQESLRRARSTNADRSMDEDCKRWERAIIECLEEIRSRPSCPRNDDGSELSLEQLSRMLMGVGIAEAGIVKEDEL